MLTQTSRHHCQRRPRKTTKAEKKHLENEQQSGAYSEDRGQLPEYQSQGIAIPRHPDRHHFMSRTDDAIYSTSCVPEPLLARGVHVG